MSWPLPHEFNEAVQSPRTAFEDADLKAGNAVCGPTGMPLPRSGNFADVYQLKGAGGKDWAVKCFTRSVTGLDQRYEKVSQALAQANLPFTIPFSYIAEGIRIRGRWLPIVKMEWVDGLQLNQFVRDNLSRPVTLDAIFGLWTRVCKRLREAGLAHADLQHGNVLLVPGSKPGQFSVKLIDYDGMYVPALANSPSGELGHPAFQHPGRGISKNYSPDLDRFPHLAIATAIKALTIRPDLWDKYDTGDNLLFVESDFQKPSESKLMRELWNTNHTAIQELVGRLALACAKPIPQTAWLDQIAPDGKVQPLAPEEAHAAMVTLGLIQQAVVPVPVPVTVPTPALPRKSFAFDEPEEEEEPVEEKISSPKRKKGTKPQNSSGKKAKNSLPMPILVAVAALVLIVGGIGAYALFGKSKKPEVAKATEPNDTPQVITVGTKPTFTTATTKSTNPSVTPPPGTVETPPIPAPPSPVPITVPLAGDAPVLKSYLETKYDRSMSNLGFVISATGSISLVGEHDGQMYLFAWEANGKKVKQAQFLQKAGSVLSTKFSALGENQFVLRAAEESSLNIYNAMTGGLDSSVNCSALVADDGKRKRYFHISPNGRYILGNIYQSDPKKPPVMDGNIRVFDTTTNKVVADYPSNTIRRAYEFSRSSDRLMFFDANGEFRTYSLPGGELVSSVKIGDGSEKFTTVGHIANDGSKLLLFNAGDGDTTGHGGLYDGKTGKLLQKYSRDVNITHSRLAPDGKGMALVRHDMNNANSLHDVLLYDASFSQTVGRIDANMTNKEPDIEYSADGRRVIVCNRNKLMLNAFDIDRLPAVAVKPPVPPVPVPNGSIAMAANAISFKPAWEAKVERPEKNDYRPQMKFIPDGGFAIRARPSALTLFDAKGTSLSEIALGSATDVYGEMNVTTLGIGMYSPKKSTIQMWNAASGKPAPEIDAKPVLSNDNSDFARRTTISPNGRYLISYLPESPANDPPKPGHLRIYDLQKKKMQIERETSPRQQWINSESNVYATLEKDGRLTLIFMDRNVGRVKTLADIEGKTFNVALGASDDGSLILAAPAVENSNGGAATLIEVPSTNLPAKPLYKFDTGFYPSLGKMDAAGKLIAVVRSPADGKGHEVCIFSVADGKITGTIALPPDDDSPKGPGFETNEMELSEDGKRLAIYNRESMILKVYDLSGAKP